MKRIFIPQTIAIVMLLWALFPANPYGYYILLRWIICAMFAYLAVKAAENKQRDWVWILALVAAIYNPIVRVHLTREIWSIMNIITIIIALLSIRILKTNKKEYFKLVIRGILFLLGVFIVYGTADLLSILIGNLFEHLSPALKLILRIFFILLLFVLPIYIYIRDHYYKKNRRSNR